MKEEVKATHPVPNENLCPLTDHHIHRLSHKLLIPAQLHITATLDLIPRKLLHQSSFEFLQPWHASVGHNIDVPEAFRYLPNFCDLVYNLLDGGEAMLQVDIVIFGGVPFISASRGRREFVGKGGECVETIPV